MKRIRRFIFNGLTAISVVLFMTTAVMWVRSNYREDNWTPPESWSRITFSSNVGVLWIRPYLYRDSQHIYVNSISDSIFVPYFILTTIFAILPLIGVVGRIVQRRRKKNHVHCFNCGYDLRATPDRCAECGTIPEKLKA